MATLTYQLPTSDPRRIEAEENAGADLEAMRGDLLYLDEQIDRLTRERDETRKAYEELAWLYEDGSVPVGYGSEYEVQA